MRRVKTFARGTERRKVSVQGVEIELEVNEHVFPPSANGSFYAESVRVNAAETVIDIGTGSGVLAIFAAKAGAVVSATDLDPAAVEVAERNAARNGVSVEFRRGALFAGLDKKFDVILANLPNEIIHRSYLDEVGEQLAHTFDGGERGNEHVLDLLQAAKGHMHGRSRLYLPVHTLTDYHETLRQAVNDYSARLVAVAQLPAKEFVEEHIDFYLRLNEAGVIRIFAQGGAWYTNGYVFELSLAAPV
ncbi:MAG: 50S ribosomal protein L11 methyltransferase [Acidobacteria bacterium]|nr:50S ribosomal protein L11 methyltransferase [Acidobacteriota bacterium]